ncbi:GPALPP motifs-containing protein 1 isoform X2 [Eublepharis macularius]|uniref:GPALPP motifs-containing protein 1 n=1 Tax=Eublepharis macularius TaxID=481883 RepID=A0AA97J1K3_EUBMA|nr:GPALPP motifs-containing protein 1 isoform X2 [Eublepharis macularius]
MASRDVIGPALPPGFTLSSAAADDDDQVAGPALPPGYGSRPKSRGGARGMESESDEEPQARPAPRKHKGFQDAAADEFFGPALPPGFKKQDDSPQRPAIGPALPPGFKKPPEEGEESRCPPRSSVPSPVTSQGIDSSEEEEAIIGPVPAKGPVESNIAADFECRARRMKEKLLGHDGNESKAVQRESWMTELPPELKHFGLGSRTFKRRADDKSGDRSIWTDTPADRERKSKEKQDVKKLANKDDGAIVMSGRDKKLAEQVSSYNDSQRAESLMDIHRKKLKRKAAEEKQTVPERRPFDRDQDLHVHQFDEAQKRALIKQSRDLNTRFSHSKSNMFL